LNSLQGLLNCEKGGLDCHVTGENNRVYDLVSIVYTCITYFAHVIYSIVSDQYSYTILLNCEIGIVYEY